MLIFILTLIVIIILLFLYFGQGNVYLGRKIPVPFDVLFPNHVEN